MFTNSMDQNAADEIIRIKWPTDICDADVDNDANWEILNENSDHDGLKRHWFKQNYVIHPHVSKPIITYH